MSAKDILDINLNLDLLIERIEALEKKYKKWKRHTIQDYFKMSKVLIHVRNNTKQIEKDAWAKIHDFDRNHDDIIELKESLNEVAQSRIGWENNIEEVLRELILQLQIFRDDEGYGKVECLRILLEKLDSNEKLPEPFICQVINRECPTADIWQYGDCKSCKEKAEPEKSDKREMKGVKYFSRWRAKEVLEKAKKDCDNRCQKLIEEFLRDFEWYLAFITHYHWTKSYSCKTNPIRFEKWMIKKWQGRIK